MLKKIATSDLTLGMYIQGFEGSWLDHPFWRTKFVLEKSEDLVLLRKSDVMVIIDVSKGADVATKPVVAQDIFPELPVVHTPVRVAAINKIKNVPSVDEIQRASAIFKSAKYAIFNMFKDVRLGKAVDQEIARQVSEDISNSVLRNSNVFVSLARLKTADDYSYMHSVAVCALMVALAKQLGMTEEECKSAGFAGLMHDLGKMDIPLDILNKPGKLTDEEFDIVKQHPLQGFNRLKEAGLTDPHVLDVCLHHHEKLDGTGYPYGLKEENLSVLARMGAICDIYDAVTSNRPYKAGWDPAESLKKMSTWTKGHLDPHLFQAFVKSIGIYPVGSLVLLSNKKLAIVIDQSPSSLLKPVVKTIFSVTAEQKVIPDIIDLSQPTCRVTILSKEDPSKWKIKNLDSYWAGEIADCY